ncbi:ABC transporter ATP-binding protein [Phytomonospora sp. NPDC050363]|uniref:ABC transporter ATP-binding protein n=1 Tax=Phytomonospora sp. NPDC050363 TaxID=3155642 RepID=UPI0033DDB9B8
MTMTPAPPTRLREAVSLWGLTKTYGTGEHAVTALDHVTLSFPRGTFTAIMGPSGSGKSTLLQCAAGLDRPSEGAVLVGATDLAKLPEKALTLLRRERVGFVFQAFNLLPALTAAQNVGLPLRLAGQRIEPGRVESALGEVGLRDRAGHRPGEMSGGQQQRVAIARALVTHPEVIFADEPTGALDTNTSREVLGLLRRVVDAFEQTVIMVTHDPMAAAYADRVVFLADGRIADDYLAVRDATATTLGHRAQKIATRMAHLEGAA